jgi:hypothetical protein
MFTIYKYPIYDNGSSTYHSIPKGGKVLHANHQQGQVAIWAEVNTEKPTETRIFQYFATGQPVIPEVGKYYRYIDTVVLRETNEVVHVYEIQEMS